jgi:hypothetical protein
MFDEFRRLQARRRSSLVPSGSIPFSQFHGAVQIGFARVITDGATCGYLADIYVLEASPPGSRAMAGRVRVDGESLGRAGARTPEKGDVENPRPAPTSLNRGQFGAPNTTENGP